MFADAETNVFIQDGDSCKKSAAAHAAMEHVTSTSVPGPLSNPSQPPTLSRPPSTSPSLSLVHCHL